MADPMADPMAAAGANAPKLSSKVKDVVRRSSLQRIAQEQREAAGEFSFFDDEFKVRRSSR
jgi:hypothetical protein